MVEFGYTGEKFRVVICNGEMCITEYAELSDKTRSQILSISSKIDLINSETVDVYNELISTLKLISTGA